MQEKAGDAAAKETAEGESYLVDWLSDERVAATGRWRGL